MLFGLMVFLVFSILAIIPLVGLLVWLILGPYFGARAALWERRGGALKYALMLGIVEASLLLLATVLVLQTVLGGLLLGTIEWMLVVLAYGLCVGFSVIGALTLPE
jgi:hypothetical protein